MKVLWFTDSPSLAASYLDVKVNITGWIESLQKEIAKIDGIELGIAFPYGNDSENNFEIETTKYFSYPYPQERKNILNFLDRWKHKIEPESIIKHYQRIVDEFKPDVIQIFGTESPFGLMIPLVNVPCVIHIQGNLTVYSHKWFSGVSFVDVLRYSNYKSIFKAYGLWHLYFLFSKRAERERKLMQYCKYFTGRTDWDRRVCNVLSPQSKYYHCEELLRNEFYNAKRWIKTTSSKIKIISTVSPMAYKGLETIIETTKILNFNNNFEYEWNIVGMKGSEEIVGIVEKIIKTKFSDQNINFKGSLNANELKGELLQSHIYVHPSHIENSPNSVCEAMILGMPIIATYSGGTPSIVENGINGLLVQDGDPWSLAGAICELIQDENLMRSLSVNAYKKAIVRHDRETVRNNMFEIYKKIVDDSRC